MNGCRVVVVSKLVQKQILIIHTQHRQSYKDAHFAGTGCKLTRDAPNVVSVDTKPARISQNVAVMTSGAGLINLRNSMTKLLRNQLPIGAQ